MLPLDAADLDRAGRAAVQQLHQLVVDLVDAPAQVVDLRLAPLRGSPVVGRPSRPAAAGRARRPGGSGGRVRLPAYVVLVSHLTRAPRSPCGCSSRKRTRALPTTTPSATAAASSHLLRRREAEAERHRHVRQRAQPLDERAGVVRERLALAGHAGAADRVDEAAARLGHPPQPLRRGSSARRGRRCRGRRRAPPRSTPPLPRAAGRSPARRRRPPPSPRARARSRPCCSSGLQ